MNQFPDKAGPSNTSKSKTHTGLASTGSGALYQGGLVGLGQDGPMTSGGYMGHSSAAGILSSNGK